MKVKISYTCGNYVWNGDPPYAEEPPICDSEGEFQLDLYEKECYGGWYEMLCPECGHRLSVLNGNLTVIEDGI